MQDLIFSVGSLCFAVALLPSLRAEQKLALPTSLLTGGWLWIFAGTYLTMGLIYSAATTGLTAALWSALAMQRRNQVKEEL